MFGERCEGWFVSERRVVVSIVDCLRLRCSLVRVVINIREVIWLRSIR